MKKSYVKYVSTVLVLALALVLIAAAVPDAAFADASYRGDVNPGPMGKLTAPKVTAKTAGRTSIQLKWKAVKGAKGYVVYRSEGQFEKNFKKVKTIKNGTASGYKDTKCKRDTIYEYEVFAYKYQNGKRVYSQTGWVTANSGAVKPYVSVWPYSSEEIEIHILSSGADRIVLYRSDSEDGSYSKIAEYNEETSSFIDQDVAFAGTYYYKAKAYKKVNGKTYASQWSDVKSCSVYDPYLDISIDDLNQEGIQRDTFLYKLSSKDTNAPATIYRSGEDEFGFFEYFYRGEKTEGGSYWTSQTPVTLDSYSLDGISYQKMPDSIVLQPGASIYLKFQSEDPVTYYRDGTVTLDMAYNGYRVEAGAILLSTTDTPRFSYDY